MRDNDNIEEATAAAAEDARADQSKKWEDPDLNVLKLRRRDPEIFPVWCLGRWWEKWVVDLAKAVSTPVDYVAVPLLACASVLIGNARWAQATSEWDEPPHLWIATVGDSGYGKSPGSDPFIKKIMPWLEQEMRKEFPDRLREWQAAQQMRVATERKWQREAKKAFDENREPGPAPDDLETPRPIEPRLTLSDVTIERVATLLANAAPKGLLILRDELAGWLRGLNNYNDAGRAFYVEAYGGRPYTVERQTREPVYVPRLVVSVFGNTQPDRLLSLLNEADDGLLSRFLWSWPNPVPFELRKDPPKTFDATEPLDALRKLAMTDGKPVMVKLSDDATAWMNKFGKYAQSEQGRANGLLRSAWGKARGHALRLSLVLELLDWAARNPEESPPTTISTKSFESAAAMMLDYFLPMAERVYSDAAATNTERKAAILARWIVDTRPAEVYVRDMIRTVRLPGLREADAIHDACEFLVDADWLRQPAPGGFQKRRREAYLVSPRIWESEDN